MKKDVSAIARKATPILKRMGVTKAFIFGSCATGRAHEKSDLDLLFKAPAKFGLLELVALQDELRDKIGREIDLVSDRAIHPALKRIISAEAIRIL